MRVRGSYKKSEASRLQVLEAAVRALSERGYARTSVNDIAEFAGMSKGAVHYHFESKDDLIEHVLLRCADSMRARIREAWDAPGEPQQRVLRALSELRATRAQAGPEVRVLADLMAQGLHNERLKGMLQAMFEANRQQVAEAILKSLPELGIRPKIPTEVIPRLLLGVLDGLALHDFFDPASEADEQAVFRAFEAIVFSLFEVEPRA